LHATSRARSARLTCAINAQSKLCRNSGPGGRKRASSVFAQLRQLQRADGNALGRPPPARIARGVGVQAQVVVDDHGVIGGDAQIHLNAVGAAVQREFHRRQSILRPPPARPAMTVNRRTLFVGKHKIPRSNDGGNVTQIPAAESRDTCQKLRSPRSRPLPLRLPPSLRLKPLPVVSRVAF